MDNNIRDLERQLAVTGTPEAHQALLCAQQRGGQRRLLGMSLSFCIKSIMRGDVQIGEVVGIIASTTGFVLIGPVQRGNRRGPNYQAIFDQYLEVYWRDFRDDLDRLIDTIDMLLPIISERQHGLPDPWIDANSPHEWGKVSEGCGEGMVGTYINPKTNEITTTSQAIRESVDRWGSFGRVRG